MGGVWENTENPKDSVTLGQFFYFELLLHPGQNGDPQESKHWMPVKIKRQKSWELRRENGIGSRGVTQTTIMSFVSYAESPCVTEVEREPREGENYLKGVGNKDQWNMLALKLEGGLLSRR